MKLVIEGRSYDLAETLREAQLIDLYRLKADTGIGLKTLAESLNAMSDMEDPMDFVEDEAGLLALNALIWLCRRRAGEKLTLEQAGAVRLDRIAFELDPDEEDDQGADPTSAPTDSDRGGAHRDEPVTTG